MNIGQAAFDFIGETRSLKNSRALPGGLQAGSGTIGFPHFTITGPSLPMEALAPPVMPNAWPAQDGVGRLRSAMA